jgi:hypothetical protein
VHPCVSLPGRRAEPSVFAEEFGARQHSIGFCPPLQRPVQRLSRILTCKPNLGARFPRR